MDSIGYHSITARGLNVVTKYTREFRINDLGKAPYRTDDQIFNRIADYLYAAALTYDRLIKKFYPHYQNRSDVFFAIWDCYEASRKTVR